MKKLLLLALTLGSATALTACGGSAKEVSNFLEQHMDVETQNFTVAYNTSNTFKVNGDYYSHTSSDAIYKVNTNGSGSKWYTSSDTLYAYDYDGQGTNGYLNYSRVDNLTSSEMSSESNNVANAATNPFELLTTAFSERIDGKDLHKFFDSVTEKNEDGDKITTYFFLDEKKTTLEETSMKVVFTYVQDEKGKNTDEFATATVTYKGNTWVYSGFDATGTISPENTTYTESIANRLNEWNNISFNTSEYLYDSETQEYYTQNAYVEINDGYYYIESYVGTNTTSNKTYRYVKTETDGSYTVLTREGVTSGLWTETLSATVDVLDWLLPVLSESTFDAAQFEKVSGTTSSARLEYGTSEAAIADGVDMNLATANWIGSQSLTGTLYLDINADSTGEYSYLYGYQLSNYKTYLNTTEAKELDLATDFAAADEQKAPALLTDVLAALTADEQNFTYNRIWNSGNSEATTDIDNGLYHVTASATQYFLDRTSDDTDNYVTYGVDADDKWAVQTGVSTTYYVTPSNLQSSAAIAKIANYSVKVDEVTGDVTYYQGSETSGMSLYVSVSLGTDLATSKVTYCDSSWQNGNSAIFSNFGTISLTAPTEGDSVPTVTTPDTGTDTEVVAVVTTSNKEELTA